MPLLKNFGGKNVTKQVKVIGSVQLRTKNYNNKAAIWWHYTRSLFDVGQR